MLGKMVGYMKFQEVELDVATGVFYVHKGKEQLESLHEVVNKLKEDNEAMMETMWKQIEDLRVAVAGPKEQEVPVLSRVELVRSM